MPSVATCVRPALRVVGGRTYINTYIHACAALVNVNVNVNNLLAISESDFDNSGERGPQPDGVNHLETPLRQLHVTYRASSCA